MENYSKTERSGHTRGGINAQTEKEYYYWCKKGYMERGCRTKA
jgi:hypothetical protein